MKEIGHFVVVKFLFFVYKLFIIEKAARPTLKHQTNRYLSGFFLFKKLATSGFHISFYDILYSFFRIV